MRICAVFGVASLENIRVLPYATNLDLKNPPNILLCHYGVGAAGERMAADIRTEPFSKSFMTPFPPKVAYFMRARILGKIVSLWCADCGVAVSFITSIKARQ